MARRIPALLLVCATLLFFSAGTAFATPASWTTTQVTSDPIHHGQVGISGDRLVWRNGNGTQGISTWRVGESTYTPIPVGDGTVMDTRISGDRVAWWSYAGGSHIKTWAVGESAATTVSSVHGHSGGMDLDGDRIGWYETPDTVEHAFVWAPGYSQPTTVSGGGAATDPRISGDRVAWSESDGSIDQIHTRVLGAAAVQLTSDASNKSYMQVSGNRVAWAAQAADASWSVVTWTPTSGVATVGPCVDGPLAVSGERIAWLASDGVVSQVMTWKAGDSAPTTVSASPTDCSSVVLSGDRIAWRAWEGSALQVFTRAAGDVAPTKITSGTSSVDDLAISGDRLAWSASDGTYYQVYTAVAVPAPAPTVTRLTKPSVSPGTVKRNKTATFRANLTPGAAMRVAGAKAKLRLYRSEKKTVTKVVKGKKKRVKVTYWRLRATLTMKCTVSGSVAKLSASTKLRYKGSWKAVVSFGGSSGYTASSSAAKTFRVR
jgi:hypothetical protein